MTIVLWSRCPTFCHAELWYMWYAWDTWDRIGRWFVFLLPECPEVSQVSHRPNHPGIWKWDSTEKTNSKKNRL